MIGSLIEQLQMLRTVEYVVLDENLQIIDFSTGVRAFSASPENIETDKDVRLAFPDIIGLEAVLFAILSQAQTNFDLKGLAYAKEGADGYFDLHIGYEDNCLLLLLEDVTACMTERRDMRQKLNSTTLSLHRLTESLTYRDRLINSLADGVVVTDVVGCILLANSAAQQLFGKPNTPLDGHLISSLFMDPAVLEFSSKCAETFEGELFRNNELLLAQESEEHTTSHRTISVTCVVLKAEQQCFVYSIKDVTNTKDTLQFLQDGKKRLERRNQEITLLDELNARLQTCLRVDEVYAIAPNILSAFFQDGSGVIYSLDESSSMLDCAAGWNSGLHLSAPIFKITDCWALRLGKPYRFCGSNPQNIACHHLRTAAADTEHICRPLSAQGMTHGLLYWGGFALGTITDEVQDLIDTIAERIALAIANIKMRDHLEERSIRDQLTGAFNRRYLEESLEQLVHRATRQKTSLSIALVDIDHFKRFNDTYGHAAGDKVLREFSLLMSSHVRVCDVVCRYGGEEFVIVLPETTADIAQRRLSSLCNIVRELRLHHAGQVLPPITASVGLVSLVPHGRTVLELLNAADEALYTAKRNGRDCIVMVETITSAS